MKRFHLGFIALTVIILNMLTPSAAKAETWAEFLTGKLWQTQKPNPYSLDMTWVFANDGKVHIDMLNWKTSAKDGMIARYKIVGSTLTITDKSGSYQYQLEYVNANKIYLKTGDAYFILAKSGSSEDTWYSEMTQRMINDVNQAYPIYTPTPSTSSTSSGYKSCYTCFGAGNCRVCGGTGIYSMYGQSSTCSACSGTGKCWHCHGSGKQ